jgi:hypothetical protein
MTRQHWLGMWSDPAKELPAPDFYLCGHNHDIEHIEKSARPQTSFVTSGGGGGEPTYRLYNNLHGPFSRRLHGFVHLHFTADTAEIAIVGATPLKESNKFKPEDFSIVHAFRRDLKTGKVEITAEPKPQIDPGEH